MQLYRAELRCAEPVSLGFSCNEPDTQVFSHAGEPLTREHTEKVINENSAISCWKCLRKNWRIKLLTPISYRSKSEATRT